MVEPGATQGDEPDIELVQSLEHRGVRGVLREEGDRLLAAGGYGASNDQAISMCCYGLQGGGQ